MVSSSLAIGWPPPARSTMLSRRWPSAADASANRPAPSGPRCARTSRMPTTRAASSVRNAWLATIPAIPHMRGNLREVQVLETLDHAVEGVVTLDGGAAGAAERGGVIRVIHQRDDGIGEPLGVAGPDQHAVLVAADNLGDAA